MYVFRCDTEVTVEDVFREPTPIEFEAEGASDAVMHFFGYVTSCQSYLM